MVKTKELFDCEYCKSSFSLKNLAEFCEETDIKNQYLMSLSHQKYIKEHKDIIYNIDKFLKKFRDDNELSLIEIPIKLETHNHGILIHFDPDKIFDSLDFSNVSDIEKARQFIIWMKVFQLLSQKPLDIQSGKALVDRFYLNVLLSTFNEVFKGHKENEAN